MANRFYSRAALDAVRRSDALRHELTPARRAVVGGKDRFVCPCCKRDGKVQIYQGNRDGASTWACVACGARGDVVTLYQVRDGFTSRADAITAVMARWGDVYGTDAATITTGDSSQTMNPAGFTTTNPGGFAVNNSDTATAGTLDGFKADTGAWRRRCQDYLRRCAAALPGSPGEQYLLGRALTVETMRRFALGYDARAMRPTMGGALKYGRKAIVIPYSRRLEYYQARFLTPIKHTDGGTTKAMKPASDAAGPEPLFNPGALYAYDAVIVTEGPLDAMSVAQGAAMMGGDGAKVGAVALNGAHAHSALLTMLKARPTAARLIIALDDDDDGRTGAAELSAKLDVIHQAHEVLDGGDVWGGFKDANGLLQYDATLMTDAISFMLLSR